MAQFFNVLPPAEALALLFAHLSHRTPVEQVRTATATGRITANPLYAPHALPTFRRSTMDGYAVRAADSYGASQQLPALLRVVGEVAMGQPAGDGPAVGEAILIHTGGMLPAMADAVAQVEHTQPVTADEIELFRPVAVGQNVLQIGEDVQAGALLFPAGHLLRPQDIGGLLALGLTQVAVATPPRVTVLATGDELQLPEAPLAPGQVRDINSYTVGGQIQQAGGLPILAGIIPDALQTIQAAAAKALAESDMLVLSAGSSVSGRDVTMQAIAGLGRPGVLLHGVATRPGKPTIVGVAAGKPVLGLPGNPVSAMIQFHIFGRPAIYRLQGMAQPPDAPRLWARLSHNIASETGREDYIPAKLEQTEQGWLARPLFGKSNLIYTLVNGDGLIKIPMNVGGVPAGEWVECFLF